MNTGERKILFEPTAKQQLFIDAVFNPENKYIAYGGSAGGGKTFCGLATLILLCRLYSHSRWCVIRKSLTEIKLNTLPSFWKLCPVKYVANYNKSEHIVTFRNESQIIFKGENIDADPELQWMDGLEVNGFLLEQIEELSEKGYDKAKLRAGRHILTPMPPIKIMMTLNPSQNWVKKLIYEPFINEAMTAPYAYIPAKISDNPFLPEAYTENLKYLDRITYRRYVEGDWSAFAINNPFAYAFDKTKHVGDCSYDQNRELLLSFDFNIDPITCIAGQHYDGCMRIFKEFRLMNSDIYELCERIKAAYPNSLYVITGDATGQNRSAMTKGKMNYYRVIKQSLGVSDGQIKVPTINPAVADSRVLVNSLLQNYQIIISPTCEFLIEDLSLCDVNEEGDIDKTKNKHRTHLLDTFRYMLNTHLRNFIKQYAAAS